MSLLDIPKIEPKRVRWDSVIKLLNENPDTLRSLRDIGSRQSLCIINHIQKFPCDSDCFIPSRDYVETCICERRNLRKYLSKLENSLKTANLIESFSEDLMGSEYSDKLISSCASASGLSNKYIDTEEFYDIHSEYMEYTPGKTHYRENITLLDECYSYLSAKAESLFEKQGLSESQEMTRYMLRDSRSTVGTCVVPIAGVGPYDPLLGLEIEVKRPGNGFLHYWHTFPYSGNEKRSLPLYSPDTTFAESIQKAWEEARRFVSDTDGQSLDDCDGRWKLTEIYSNKKINQEEEIPITGSSASAAAARAWVHALKGIKVDKDVLVLSQTKDRGELHPVDGIEDKVRSAISNGQIDTFITTSNRKDLVDRITNPESTTFKVVAANDIQGLVSQRSLLVDGLLEYFEALTEKMDSVAWQSMGARSFDVPANVLIKSPQDPSGNTITGKTPQPISNYELGQISHNELRHFTSEDLVQRWDEIENRHHGRVILLGSPGGGKTFITRQSCLRMLKNATDGIRRQSSSAEDVTVPIWVTATDLANVAPNKNLSEALIEAQGNSLRGVTPPNESVMAWLVDALNNRTSFVVIDALDELPENRKLRNSFAVRATQLYKSRCQVTITCRPRPWREGNNLQSLVDWNQTEEMNITRFNPAQIRDYIYEFFADDTTTSNELLSYLEGTPKLHEAASNPLILSLLSLLRRDEDIELGTNLSQLYGRLCRSLLRGDWKGEEGPIWSTDGVLVEEKRDQLSSIALELFKENPSSNSFSFREWTDSASKSKSKLANKQSRDLLNDLKDLGLIIEGGSTQFGDQAFRFSHRTMFEYLAALGLSAFDEATWLSESKKHIWFEPSWRETIVFLAGLVTDMSPLVNYILTEHREGEDIFGNMVRLCSVITGASDSLSKDLSEEVGSEAFNFWVEAVDSRNIQIINLANECLQTISANQYAAPYLSNRIGELCRGSLEVDADPSQLQRDNVIIGSEDNESFEDIPTVPKPVSWRLRREAIRVMGTIDEYSTINTLKEVIATEDPDLKIEVCRALSNVASNAGLELLERMCDDIHPEVRRSAVWVLGWREGTKSSEKLLEDLCLKETEDVLVRWAAIHALGWLTTDSSLEILMNLMKDKNPVTVQEAATALWIRKPIGKSGELIALTGKDNPPITRQESSWVLGNLQSESITETMKDLATDNDKKVREHAAGYLSKLPNHEIKGDLIYLSRNDSHSSRAFSIYTVSLMDTAEIQNDDDLFKILLRGLSDPDNLVKETALVAINRLSLNHMDQISEQVTPDVIKLAQHTCQNIRNSAFKLLSNINCTEDTLRFLTSGSIDDPKETKIAILHTTACILDNQNFSDPFFEDKFHDHISIYLKDDDIQISDLARESLMLSSYIPDIQPSEIIEMSSHLKLALIKKMAKPSSFEYIVEYQQKLAQDPDPNVRRAVTGILNQPTPETEQTLITLMDDENHLVKSAATNALQNITWSSKRKILR